MPEKTIADRIAEEMDRKPRPQIDLNHPAIWWVAWFIGEIILTLIAMWAFTINRHLGEGVGMAFGTLYTLVTIFLIVATADKAI